MPFTLHPHERMLLELLRSSINSLPIDTTLFESSNEVIWNKCFALAKEQGVMALAWDGVIQLPKQLLPPMKLKLRWALAVEAYEKQYFSYCKTIIDLSKFYARNGIKTLVLKGIGLSTYYPIPQHREGGDIDIYTFSANHSAMNDTEANELADQLMLKLNKRVEYENEKHSLFYYHNIPIENHKSFLDIQKGSIAIPVEKALRSKIHPIEIPILKGEASILVPSEEFNRLFVSFHAMRHYGVGLCLHHLCDWACILNHASCKLPHDFDLKGYKNFLQCATAFTNQYLGTHVQTEYSESGLEKLCFELFRSPYKEVIHSNNPLVILRLKAKRFFYYRRALKEIEGVSISKGIWESVVKHIKHPHLIIGKK